MEMKNCKTCGKVFASVSGEKICQECQKREDELFKVVKEYIYDHPNASIAEVSEATEVEEEIILRYLKDGRIEITNGEGCELHCEKCGKKILVGKYCADCQKDLLNKLSQATTSKKTEESGPRMYSQGLRNSK